MHLLKDIIPSMFHRRLLLLSGVITIGALPLWAQLSRLTLGRSDEFLKESEAKLVRRQWTPSIRGSILDRKGRVLAQDRPSFDVVVAYNVITGDWAIESARTAARRAYGTTGWAELNAAQREEAIARVLPTYQIHLDKAWDQLALTLGVSRDEIDTRRDAIVADLTRKHEALIKRRLAKEIEDFQAREIANLPRGADPAALPTPNESQLAAMERRANQPIAEFRQSHVMAGRISDDLGFAVGTIASQGVIIDEIVLDDRVTTSEKELPLMPGLSVQDSGDRDYPYEMMEIAVSRNTLPQPMRIEDELTIPIEGVACHILGRLRDSVFGDKAADPQNNSPFIPGDATKRREFLAANPDINAKAITTDGQDRGAYREGDRVGDTGVEGSQENLLRGIRGLATTQLDTGEKDYIPAVPGSPIALTLDIMLQARVQAAMSPELGLATVQGWHQQESDTQQLGQTLHGAAVVLDIDTAEILAMVSTPTFTRADLKHNPSAVFSDITTTPYLNRAIAKPYPPGSIVKPMILTGAITMGNYRPDERLQCTGHLLPDRPTILSCLVYKRYKTTHNEILGRDLDGTDAVMQSCNVFFFTMGRRMGQDSVCRIYREYGLCEPFHLGIGAEFPGQLGLNNDGSDLGLPDAIQMAIGQGPVSWTPLHAADAYATLARAGVFIQPQIVKSHNRSQPRELGLNPSSVTMAMKGLQAAVNSDQGTGHHLNFDGVKEPIFNAPNVQIWGKTGTATAPNVLGEDPDGKEGPLERPILQSGDHSWFVIMVGRDRPRYVISVVIDYGGSGGKVSGPIANQIIHALIAEGYL